MSFLLGVCSLSFAQSGDNTTDSHDVTIDIPEVALLDIEAAGSKSITLTPTIPTEAGLALDLSSATDNSLWLNYSSIIGSTTRPLRKVTVEIESGTVPGGIDIKVLAGNYSGGGEGTTGTAGAALTLSSAAQDIITDIGSCYTGNGTSNGHQLNYSLEFSSGNYGNLDFDEDDALLSIKYTLVEQ